MRSYPIMKIIFKRKGEKCEEICMFIHQEGQPEIKFVSAVQDKLQADRMDCTGFPVICINLFRIKGKIDTQKYIQEAKEKGCAILVNIKDDQLHNSLFLPPGWDKKITWGKSERYLQDEAWFLQCQEYEKQEKEKQQAEEAEFQKKTACITWEDRKQIQFCPGGSNGETGRDEDGNTRYECYSHEYKVGDRTFYTEREALLHLAELKKKKGNL